MLRTDSAVLDMSSFNNVIISFDERHLKIF